jgi:hypothetical protein
MFGPLVKAATLIALTHGVRALGCLAGPRRGALLLGLPCTTAFLLLASGREHGPEDALAMSEAGLTALGAGPRLAIAAAAVLIACRLAGRIRTAEERDGGGSLSPAAVLALRTLVPLASLLLLKALRGVGGPEVAGLFLTFPAMSLALLVVTHLESGPVAAWRFARAMPPGNLGMVAFLAAFRYAGPAAGLAWATTLGVAAAASALLVVERLGRPTVRAEPGAWRLDGPRLISSRRPRRPTRFAPRLEPIAC